MAETAEYVEHLIELVYAVPAIWNKVELEYRDTDFRKNAFQSIANKLGKPVEEVKKRWDNLRDKFHKDFKEYGNSGTGKPGGKRKKKWPYFDRLMFLNENQYNDQ